MIIIWVRTHIYIHIRHMHKKVQNKSDCFKTKSVNIIKTQYILYIYVMHACYG